MRPAFSVIFFTTASGAGYGLLAVLGLLAPWGVTPMAPRFALFALALGLALVTGGLVSSTFHLGHPERAWRALSQWRTSWLSREGVSALVAYPIIASFAASWLLGGRPNLLLGLLTAAIAVTTVFCTAQIYATLRPIRQWAHPLTVPGYLVLGLFTGLAMLGALTASAFVAAATAIAAVVALVLKNRYWRSIDTTALATTLGTATGLGAFGRVRMLDPPHGPPNFLMRELAYRIARANAVHLRFLALVAGFALPALLLAAGIATQRLTLLAPLAAVLALAGTAVERWLFFAEATHTQALYYGLDS